jgi:hypothetical protein
LVVVIVASSSVLTVAAASDRRHGLPVEGLEPALQPIELETGSAPRSIGKSPQDVQGIAEKVERLHVDKYIVSCIISQEFRDGHAYILDYEDYH